MSQLASQLYNLTRPTHSKATDKLNALLASADALVERNPTLLSRVTSLSIEWSNMNGETVPNVKIELKDPVPDIPRGGSVG